MRWSACLPPPPTGGPPAPLGTCSSTPSGIAATSSASPRRRTRWLHWPIARDRVVSIVLAGSEQNTRFEQEAGLCGIHAVPAKRQSRCRATRPDVRDLCAHEEDFILIGRGQGDRPRIAAWAIEQVWGAIIDASCAGDVFETNGNAE